MTPLTDEQKKAILDCEQEVLKVLEKYGCHLEGVAILKPAIVDVQIVVAINAAEEKPVETPVANPASS